MKNIKASEEDRRPGILSSEAVQWFTERDSRTLAQATAFVPWVIQRGIKLGTVTDDTDSVCLSAVFSDSTRLLFIEVTVP